MRQGTFSVILMPTLCFGNVLQPRGCFELSLERVCSRRAVFEQIQTFLRFVLWLPRQERHVKGSKSLACHFRDISVCVLVKRKLSVL